MLFKNYFIFRGVKVRIVDHRKSYLFILLLWISSSSCFSIIYLSINCYWRESISYSLRGRISQIQLILSDSIQSDVAFVVVSGHLIRQFLGIGQLTFKAVKVRSTSTFNGSSLWGNISTAGFNLEGETSNPDEIVNLRNIPIFGAKFAGWWLRKNAIMTIAIQSDDPLNIRHTRLFF